MWARCIGILRLASMASMIVFGVAVSAELSRTTPDDVVTWWVMWPFTMLLVWIILTLIRMIVARRSTPPDPPDFPLRWMYAPTVEATLPRGESLVNFVPTIEAPLVKGSLALARREEMSAHGLALTTVGLRLVSFGSAQSGRRSAGTAPTITGEFTMRMSDISSVQFERVTCVGRDLVVRELGRRFGAPLIGSKPWHPVRMTGLRVMISGRRGVTLWAMHREIDALIANLNAMRSGDFLATRTSGVADAMERLSRMVADGVMTHDEFDRVKAGFVGSAAALQESTESRIRQLHGLMQDGILTASEFRQKKWDLLSRTA